MIIVRCPKKKVYIFIILAYIQGCIRMFESEPETMNRAKMRGESTKRNNRANNEWVQGQSPGKLVDYQYPRCSDMLFLAIDLHNFYFHENFL